MSQQTVELVQIVVSVDGELCQVIIPEDYKMLVVRMLQGVGDGALNVARLPPNFQKVKLSDLAS